MRIARHLFSPRKYLFEPIFTRRHDDGVDLCRVNGRRVARLGCDGRALRAQVVEKWLELIHRLPGGEWNRVMVSVSTGKLSELLTMLSNSSSR